MQIKITIKNHLTLVRMAIIKKTTNNKCWQGSGEKEPLAFGGNVSWHYWPLWKMIWRSLKKLKTELPYDPSVPLLGTYLKKMKTLTQEDTCIPMFSAALFTKAKIWKQPKYQWQMKRSLKCDRQLHTHVLRTHTHKQWNIIQSLKEILPGTTQVDLKNNSKWKKSDTNTKWSHLYVESKNKTAKNISLDTENRQVVARNGWKGQKVQHSNYKISKS